MYTGTMINDLMAVVERTNQNLQQQRMEAELHEIFTMQIAVVDSETAYMGAA